METILRSPSNKFKHGLVRAMHALVGLEPEERRIRLTAIAVLLAVVFVSGLVILTQASGNIEAQLMEALDRSVRDRVNLMKQALQRANETGASIANDRPHLKTVLGRMMDGQPAPTDEADVSRILDNIAKRANMRAIELRDGNGKILGTRGKFIGAPRYSAPVSLSYAPLLIWDQRFALDQTVPIVEAGRKLGVARVQMALAEIDELFTTTEGLGERGDFVICAKRAASNMTCYPSRQSPDGAKQASRYSNGKSLPMDYALSGKSGTLLTADSQGQKIVAAYGAVGSTGVGMLIKRDHAEFTAMSRRSFIYVLPFLLLLSAGGVWLLGWRVAPLVRKLVESRAQVKAVIDSAPDAIVSLDERGRIGAFNPAAVTMFFYQPREVEGRPMSMLAPDAEEEASSGVLVSGLAYGRRKDGVRFPMEVSVAKASSAAGASYVATLRDITLREQAQSELKARYEEVQKLNAKLKEAQNQLLQSEKMASVGQLAAGVAHEINNPIGYVYSNLGTLDHYVKDILQLVSAYEEAEPAIAEGVLLERLTAAKQQTDVTFLRVDIAALMTETREGITRVKKIVQDLKDFSHIDASDEWHWANLQKGIDSTLNIVWNELKYKVEVRKEYADIPEVECRPSQLNQVFLNLLVNAGHAIKDKGVITIRTGQQDLQVWVEIADDGCGIDSELLSRIFDPFFTTKPIGQGTGLGLSLSYGIVQSHGGRIDVTSAPGQGTTFRVWLPIAQHMPLEAESHA